MTLYTPSLAIDDVIDALGSFIQLFVGTAEVIRAEVNRVAPPAGPFVELTEILSVDLETPHVWNDTVAQTSAIKGPARIDIQVDFYGPSAGDWCKAVKGTFRTSYAASQFPANIQPLYCSDGIQSPLITGEEQYEVRWTITCSLQYSPIVTVPQQSATALSVNEIEDIL
jgi:hypothetical protein